MKALWILFIFYLFYFKVCLPVMERNSQEAADRIVKSLGYERHYSEYHQMVTVLEELHPPNIKKQAAPDH